MTREKIFTDYMDKFEKLKDNFLRVLTRLPRGHYLLPDVYYGIGKLWIDLYENVEKEMKEKLEIGEEKRKGKEKDRSVLSSVFHVLRLSLLFGYNCPYTFMFTLCM